MDENLIARDEAEWIRLAREGAPEAFEPLLLCCYLMILALAFHLIGRHHDVEGIGQEVFIGAARSSPRIRGERDSNAKKPLFEYNAALFLRVPLSLKE